MYTIQGLHGAGQIALIYFPFHSHFAHNPSISWVIFTPSRRSFFSPVCKCTIKELVVRNHRIWTRAKSGQLFTRRPQILNWSPLLQPCPHHHGHHPGGWHRQEGETSHLHARQRPARTRPFQSCTLPEVKPCWWLATSLQTEIYLKRRSPKIIKSWIIQGCFYRYCFTLVSVGIFLLKVMLHTSLKKSLLLKLFPSIFITARFIWNHFCFVL